MKRVVVTGAAGFIGSHLCERLLEEGYRVSGIDSFTDYYSPDRKRRHLKEIEKNEDFTLIEADIADCDLDSILDGAVCVFHLAAQAGVRRSWGSQFHHYVSSNITATQKLLEAMRERQGVRLVFASSSSVYGDTNEVPMREQQALRPVSPYGATKLFDEHLLDLYRVNYGLEYVALRYFTVFGPRQRPDMAFSRFITAALAGKAVEVYGNGRQTRDFTFVSDAVSATVGAMGYGGQQRVFNIGGGNRASILEVLDTIERLTGSRIDIRHTEPVKGDVLDTWADTSKAEAELGFRPTVPLEEGLAREIAWYRSHMQAPKGR